MLDGIDWELVLWLIIGLVSAIGELLTGTMFLLPFAVGGFAAAGAAALGANLQLVLLVFLVVSGGTLVWAAQYGKRLRQQPPATREGANRYVDATGVLTSAIEGRAAGRVRIGSESWRAVSATGSSIATDVPVRVVEVRGNALVVEPDRSDQ